MITEATRFNDRGRLATVPQAARCEQRAVRMSAAAGTIALAAMLLLPASLATAAPNNAGPEEGWSEWQALPGGHAGRRREPPRMNLPASERRLARVQARQRGRGAEARAGVAALALSARAAEPQAAVLSETSDVCRSARVDALWLQTGAAGLYSVPIADLAVGVGKHERQLRRRAQRGLLSLTNAGRPWSWSYNADADSVEFAAESYDTFFTDRNAFRFSVSNREAQPMRSGRGRAPRTGGLSTAFRDTVHFEEEPTLMFVTWAGAPTWAVSDDRAADFWFWDYLFGAARESVDLLLDVPDPAADGDAAIRVGLQGGTQLYPGDEHRVAAFIVTVDAATGAEVEELIGWAVWDGLNPAVLEAEFPQALLAQAGETRLRLRAVFDAGEYPIQFVDEVEIAYHRQPIAVDGKLWMHDVTAGIQTVTGFGSEDIAVIEAPSGAAVLRRDVRIDSDGAGGFAVTFAALSGADYLIAERGAAMSASTTPDYRSRLRRRNNRADYVVLTADEFAGAAAALAEHRRGRYRRVEVVCLGDVYDEFADGREDPAAIARFVDYAVDNWRGAPDALTMLGAGKIDHKDRMGYGDSFLPVVMTATDWGLAPSDERLLGGDGPAPIAFGRLPIQTVEEGIDYVAKLAAHESNGLGVGLSAAVVADDGDEGGDFHADSDVLASRLGDLGFGEVLKVYHPGGGVRAALVDSDTWDTHLLSYTGHGSAMQAGDNKEKFLAATDAAALSNTRYPVFSALTCAVGDDSLPGTRSLASTLVLNPGGGAIVALAPAGLSYNDDAQLIGGAFVDRLFGDMQTVGTAARAAKEQTKNSVADFMPGIYGIIGDAGVEVP